MKRVIYFVLIISGLSGLSACTPIYVTKANTTMNGVCTDVSGCNINTKNMIQPYKYT